MNTKCCKLKHVRHGYFSEANDNWNLNCKKQEYIFRSAKTWFLDFQNSLIKFQRPNLTNSTNALHSNSSADANKFQWESNFKISFSLFSQPLCKPGVLCFLI